MKLLGTTLLCAVLVGGPVMATGTTPRAGKGMVAKVLGVGSKTTLATVLVGHSLFAGPVATTEAGRYAEVARRVAEKTDAELRDEMAALS